MSVAAVEDSASQLWHFDASSNASGMLACNRAALLAKAGGGGGIAPCLAVGVPLFCGSAALDEAIPDVLYSLVFARVSPLFFFALGASREAECPSAEGCGESLFEDCTELVQDGRLTEAAEAAAFDVLPDDCDVLTASALSLARFTALGSGFLHMEHRAELMGLRKVQREQWT